MTREIVTDGRHIPDPVKEWVYWVLWDFDLKQPRAPWENDHCFPSEWRQDGEIDPRTDFNQANAAADLGPEMLHKSYPFPEEPPERVGPTLLLPHPGDETPGPTPAEPPLLFIDYDDVIVDGEIPGEVWDVAASVGGPLFVSRSFEDPEKDAAGLHQLARGTLPGSLTCVPKSDFEERGHIEIYKQSRMTGFTWRHVRGTPTDELPDATDAVADVVNEYGSDNTKRRGSVDPDVEADTTALDDLTPPEELADMDTTDDMDDVFSAIRQVTDGDIRLRSTVTEEGARKSYDPSWVTSNSGTRLGYDTIAGEETWIYRAANQPVDALQVVAAEERIITDVADYPEGSDFWKAVGALRERGATIPYFEGDSGTHPDYLRLFERADTDDDKRRKALRAMRASKRAGAQ